jgi:hypothetical protein
MKGGGNKAVLPWFAVLFIAAAGLNSLGALPTP